MAYDEPRIAADPVRRSASLPVDDWAPRPEDGTTVPPGSDGGAEAPPAARRVNRGARAVREIVETLLLALVIFLAVRLVVLNFRVDGLSMFPNLDDGEMLLVNRNAYARFSFNDVLNLLPGEDRPDGDILFAFDPPERGDIVVFDPPVRNADKPYIKRVIGLPGDRVTFRNGNVFVNGEPLDEPYIADDITRCDGNDRCSATVGEGEVFVLGDNREHSEDSRAFGPVDVDAIVGKAWFGYWPVDDIGLVPHEDYPALPER
jgi:signal peptidase I